MIVSLFQKPPRQKWVCACKTLLICGFMTLAFISFIYAPFNGDIEVFIAAENQVKYKEVGGIRALFEAWELKGIGNRTLMYVLYRLALIFVPYGSVTTFELAVKTIYAIIILFFITGTAVFISKDRRLRSTVFVIEFVAVFCTYTASQLQAEMTCVILACFLFALLIHDRKYFLITAGAIGGVLFFYKSIFFLLFFVSLLGAVAYRDNSLEGKNIVLSIGSFTITELILIIFVKLYYPQEFGDMSAAAYFQTTLFSEGSNVGLQSMMNSLQIGFIGAMVGSPFLILGICSVLVLIICYVRQRDWKRLIEIICMWVLVLDIIVASNKYFIYHYYLLTLPCFICVLLLMKHIKPDTGMICFSGIMAFCMVLICWILKDGLKQIPVINNSTVLLTIIHLLILVVATCFLRQCSVIRRFSLFLALTTCAFFYMNYSSFIAPKYRNERMLLKQSEEACKKLFPDDFGDEPVLFLDGGTVPFYVDAPSYSRYFFCLPLQRWKEGEDWKLQKQEYERVMLYKGKYIVYSNWFGLEKYPDLLEKIEAEYERIPDSGIWTFSPDWNFFKLDSQTDIGTLRVKEDNYILKRK